MINYYDILGVQSSASAEEIKTAYRQLAKRHHPDVGGDPVKFSRIGDAYEVLSDEKRRKVFDQVLRSREEHQSAPAPDRPAFRSKPAPPRKPGPPLTRVMSLPIKPRSRFLLEGLTGSFSIQPTTPENLWKTTLRKFGSSDLVALAREVVQIRLRGPRELVQRILPKPTEFGIRLQGSGTEMFKEESLRSAVLDGGSVSAFMNAGQFALSDLMDAQVTLEATLPLGSAVYLYDTTGEITLGDLDSELVATLDGKSVLRAQNVNGLDITLSERAKAHIAQLKGKAEIIILEEGKLLIGGNADHIRAVLEHQAHLEIVGNVEILQATVSGRAYLNAKGVVGGLHCDVRAGGYARIANVQHSVSGHRSGGGHIDILRGPPEHNAPRSGFR